MTKEQVEDIKKIGIPSEELYQEVCDELLEYKQLEKELGCSMVDLLNGLKSKQSALRYFDKHDSIVNHCEEGWYVNMIMYGWIPLKDFMKGLK